MAKYSKGRNKNINKKVANSFKNFMNLVIRNALSRIAPPEAARSSQLLREVEEEIGGILNLLVQEEVIEAGFVEADEQDMEVEFYYSIPGLKTSCRTVLCFKEKQNAEIQMEET